jgi:hypothetical protein
VNSNDEEDIPLAERCAAVGSWGRGRQDHTGNMKNGKVEEVERYVWK